MSVITFPSTLTAQRIRWEQVRNDMEGRSIFGSQAMEVSAPLWGVSLEGALRNDVDVIAGEWKSLMMRLRGRMNQLELWDLMRPVPNGTMRGTMTLNAGAAQGATSILVVAAGQNAKTILKGDFLGLGSGLTQQVVMAVADATSDGSGIIALTIEPSLRNSFLVAAAVTWDKPKALFRRTSSRAGWDYSSVFTSGFGLELIEDWRP